MMKGTKGTREMWAGHTALFLAGNKAKTKKARNGPFGNQDA
jgi:hypothetical protein